MKHHHHQLHRLAVLIRITLLMMVSSAVQAVEQAWAVAGRQGLVQFVIVPLDKAKDRHAYDAQIKQLCAPETTCFLNFYTNSTNAALTMPLPDAIDYETTARYRRSMKNGVEKFQWSCRLKITQDDCF